jgi:hypothetical protein
MTEDQRVYLLFKEALSEINERDEFLRDETKKALKTYFRKYDIELDKYCKIFIKRKLDLVQYSLSDSERKYLISLYNKVKNLKAHEIEENALDFVELMDYYNDRFGGIKLVDAVSDLAPDVISTLAAKVSSKFLGPEGVDEINETIYNTFNEFSANRELSDISDQIDYKLLEEDVKDFVNKMKEEEE